MEEVEQQRHHQQKASEKTQALRAPRRSKSVCLFAWGMALAPRELALGTQLANQLLRFPRRTGDHFGLLGSSDVEALDVQLIGPAGRREISSNATLRSGLFLAC